MKYLFRKAKNRCNGTYTPAELRSRKRRERVLKRLLLDLHEAHKTENYELRGYITSCLLHDINYVASRLGLGWHYPELSIDIDIQLPGTVHEVTIRGVIV
jgi:hypothetical protein